MIKMYNAEVLSKFPVVQHFPFGSLFSFDRDPNAKAIAASVHTSSQPRSNSSTVPSSTSSTSAYSSPRQLPPSQASQAPLRNPLAPPQSQAPLRNPMADGGAMTAAPWAKVTPTASQASLRSSVTGGMTAAPWATPMTSRPAAGPNVPSGPDKPTRAPWTSRTPASPPPTESTSRVPPGGDVVTKAPWAK
jgi:serine/threonine-protein phosphatase 2A activator